MMKRLVVGIALIMVLAGLLTAAPVLAQGPEEAPATSEQALARFSQGLPAQVWQQIRTWLHWADGDGEQEALNLSVRWQSSWQNGAKAEQVATRSYDEAAPADPTADGQQMNGAGPQAGSSQCPDEDGDGLCDICGQPCGSCTCDGDPIQLHEHAQNGTDDGQQTQQQAGPGPQASAPQYGAGGGQGAQMRGGR
jgi:hypothetical protein